MKISYNGIQHLKLREGFKDVAYQDTGGVWTGLLNVTVSLLQRG
jgi:GH24 family phage-related lysozyme (muramidase)